MLDYSRQYFLVRVFHFNKGLQVFLEKPSLVISINFSYLRAY